MSPTRRVAPINHQKSTKTNKGCDARRSISKGIYFVPVCLFHIMPCHGRCPLSVAHLLTFSVYHRIAGWWLISYRPVCNSISYWASYSIFVSNDTFIACDATIYRHCCMCLAYKKIQKHHCTWWFVESIQDNTVISTNPCMKFWTEYKLHCISRTYKSLNQSTKETKMRCEDNIIQLNFFLERPNPIFLLCLQFQMLWKIYLIVLPFSV